MTIEAAVVNVARIFRALEGMKQAPDYPPEKLSDFPFTVTYQYTGKAEGRGLGAILTQERHTIVAEVHVQRKELASDVKKVVPYFQLLKTALKADPTIGGEVDIVQEIRYRLGALAWESTVPNNFGYRFEIDVLLNDC